MEDQKNEQQKQVELNYKAFCKKLPEIIDLHQDKFALMKDGEIIEYFDTFEDAYNAGLLHYEDKIFSVQEVTTTPVNLGFISHAMHIRQL